MHSVRQCAALRFEGLRGWGAGRPRKSGYVFFNIIQLFYMESETRGDAVIVWPSAFTSATWLYHLLSCLLFLLLMFLE